MKLFVSLVLCIIPLSKDMFTWQYHFIAAIIVTPTMVSIISIISVYQNSQLMIPVPQTIESNLFINVGILHQNFRLFLTLSLPHIIIEEASRYNLVFVL